MENIDISNNFVVKQELAKSDKKVGHDSPQLSKPLHNEVTQNDSKIVSDSDSIKKHNIQNAAKSMSRFNKNILDLSISDATS